MFLGLVLASFVNENEKPFAEHIAKNNRSRLELENKIVAVLPKHKAKKRLANQVSHDWQEKQKWELPFSQFEL